MTPSPASIHRERVTFVNDGLTLVGYVYKPAGAGPFPAVVWNHGSEQDPKPDGEFARVAELIVPAGFVLFAPERRGQGESQGPYIVDVVRKERADHGDEAGDKLLVRLMETNQLEDQLAGLKRLKEVEYVNPHQLAVMGCSYGGIQTLLAAEKGAGYKGAIAMCPGAESWEHNEVLQHRLIQAAENIDIPVLLIHPKKDANVAPGYVLGRHFEEQHKPYGLIIFPPYGTEKEQGHCFGGLNGADHIWGPSVLQFLNHILQ